MCKYVLASSWVSYIIIIIGVDQIGRLSIWGFRIPMEEGCCKRSNQEAIMAFHLTVNEGETMTWATLTKIIDRKR